MFIKHFHEIRKDHIAHVGGKGAQLGEMFNAGMPVPAGFCVTAHAYKHFIEEAKLQDKILGKLKGLDVENTAKLEKVAKEIQAHILKASLPKELQQHIKECYGKIKGFVAIRSSATAEDLPEASFAGQQSTFLNVQGEAHVLKKVQECFASLFTPRAIYYREKKGFSHDQVYLAVVVQQMVDAEKAGVIFTVNPVTNNRNEMIIEAAFGLGEALVSGMLTPDSYVIDKETGAIIDKNVSHQEWGFFREKGKTAKKKISHGHLQKLSDEELKALVEHGKRIEKHYGTPQDIEFAIADKIYILQARPVTTLK